MLNVSEPAVTWTCPEFPVLNPDSEVMPVDRFCPVPSIVKAPATLTVTLPALPVPPKVSTDIRPVVTMLRLPAATVMLPAPPVLSVSAVMPVGTVDDVPSIDSAPATVTAMLPPLPVPNVSVVIWPFELTDNDPALMVMSPEFPVTAPVLSGRESAVMPVIGPVCETPLIERAPVTFTAMLPPLPKSVVSVVI